jgi:hypothetical protein
MELPTTLIKELYRDYTLPVFKLFFIENKSREFKQFEALVKSCPDQPLLLSRIYEVSDSKRQYKLDKFIWDLDRMRRVRNSLVHTASIDVSIDLLSRRLYQYSRIYLSKVINRLAFRKYKSDEMLLLFWEE